MENSYSPIDVTENTYKQFYYALSDEESESVDMLKTQKTKTLKRTKSVSNESLDTLFDVASKKPKEKKISSTVSRAHQDGNIFITTNSDDGENATHLIKIEIYDMRRIAKISAQQQWKYAEYRLKYYAKEKENNDHRKQTEKLIRQMAKCISESKNSKKYNFKNN